jgi:hypothetical protein
MNRDKKKITGDPEHDTIDVETRWIFKECKVGNCSNLMVTIWKKDELY